MYRMLIRRWLPAVSEKKRVQINFNLNESKCIHNIYIGRVGIPVLPPSLKAKKRLHGVRTHTHMHTDVLSVINHPARSHTPLFHRARESAHSLSFRLSAHTGLCTAYIHTYVRTILCTRLCFFIIIYSENPRRGGF